MEARAPLRVGLRLAESADLVAVEKVQHDAYARNRELLGVEPLPLLYDYRNILSRYVVWLAEEHAGAGTRLAGVLALAPQDDSLLVWSIATAPFASRRGQLPAPSSLLPIWNWLPDFLFSYGIPVRMKNC